MASLRSFVFLLLLPLIPPLNAAPAPIPTPGEALFTYGNLNTPTLHNNNHLNTPRNSLVPRQNPPPLPGTEHNRILRITACFEPSGSYYLTFARDNSASRLGPLPRQNRQAQARRRETPLGGQARDGGEFARRGYSGR
ncbi:hypothetical protein B0T14DRAFT_605044 [Immersiella caudata]|uniref:Uncharacterized protein n=1 Tax=Immersiella caudata TaxID=314043 RepID=A0AA40BX58_9PEZI|nr:hypothetical protein B0T14DRAFT_605044 [Immersiella caudata]